MLRFDWPAAGDHNILNVDNARYEPRERNKVKMVAIGGSQKSLRNGSLDESVGS
jgi:hypothetical protein